MNRFEERSRESYNQKAEDYDSTPDGRFTRTFKKALLSCIDLADGEVVLDVACGNGRLLNDFHKKAAIKGVGVDISEKMIEQAKRLNPMMEFYVSPCDTLPFDNHFCDIATVCASFHHFPDVEAFAKEMDRVLKPGGRVYVAEIYLPTFLRVLCNPFIRFSKAGDVKFYAPKEIVQIFAPYGFYEKYCKTDETMQVVALQKV